MSLKSAVRLAALATAVGAFTLSAGATERRFSYTYETTTTPKGQMEFENWATWKHIGNAGEKHTNLFQFRHEVEYGITDRLQLGVYLFDWEHDATAHQTRWEHSGVELIYRLTNPTTDFLGSALYLEAVAGESSMELEGKLLLQKNFGPLRVAYNLVLEAEWEGDSFGHFQERAGEFAQTLGISYDINKKFSVGAEVLHEIPLPNWSHTEASNLFVGPNASVRFGRVFVTATALFQVSNVEGEPDTQIRVITGIDF